MGESEGRYGSSREKLLLWLLAGAFLVGGAALTVLAFVGGFVVLLYGIDWLALNAFAEQGGRDYWLVHVTMLACFPLYLFVGYKFFTGWYPVAWERVDRYADRIQNEMRYT